MLELGVGTVNVATADVAGGAGGVGGIQQPESPCLASKVAVNAARTATNASRGIGEDTDVNSDESNDDNDESGSENNEQLFVQSLLGMQLPTSTTPLTTPSITASFYATSLLTKTSTSHNGQSHWHPDDAYLAACALSLKGEQKRAIWILD